MSYHTTVSGSEADVQLTIREGLEYLGYAVLVTSRQRKRCRKCGLFSAGGDGVSRGVPDLLISRKGWGCWLGLEVKNAKGKASPAQQELADSGLLVIVRSWEEALSAVASFEAQMGFKELARRCS